MDYEARLRSLGVDMEIMVDLAERMLDQLTNARQSISEALEDEVNMKLMSGQA